MTGHEAPPPLEELIHSGMSEDEELRVTGAWHAGFARTVALCDDASRALLELAMQSALTLYGLLLSRWESAPGGWLEDAAEQLFVLSTTGHPGAVVRALSEDGRPFDVAAPEASPDDDLWSFLTKCREAVAQARDALNGAGDE